MTRVLLTLSPDARAREANERYIRALERAGAIVSPLYPDGSPPGEFDALCLSGGGDVDPKRYGERVAGTKAETIIQSRDEQELQLVAKARERGLPILGICRGFQVLNVAYGGKLKQHADGHEPPDPDRTGVTPHDVDVAPGTRLAAAIGPGRVRVNSRHHQVVLPEGLAPDLEATVLYDGIVEAFETREGWVVGVQWHPERGAEVDPAATRIFDAFVAAAR